MEPIELVHSDLMSFMTVDFQEPSMGSCLLMNSDVILGCTFFSTRVTYFIHLIHSNIVLSNNHFFLSRNYAYKMGGSMSSRNSNIFVDNMTFSIYTFKKNYIDERIK